MNDTLHYPSPSAHRKKHGELRITALPDILPFAIYSAEKEGLFFFFLKRKAMFELNQMGC